MSIRTRTVPLQTKFPLWRARYKSLYNNSVIRASTKHRTIVMSSGVHGNRHLISVIEGTCGNRGDVALRASSVSGDKFDGSQVLCEVWPARSRPIGMDIEIATWSSYHNCVSRPMCAS
jgi:hypothetical protein